MGTKQFFKFCWKYQHSATRAAWQQRSRMITRAEKQQERPPVHTPRRDGRKATNQVLLEISAEGQRAVLRRPDATPSRWGTSDDGVGSLPSWHCACTNHRYHWVGVHRYHWVGNWLGLDIVVVNYLTNGQQLRIKYYRPVPRDKVSKALMEKKHWSDNRLPMSPISPTWSLKATNITVATQSAVKNIALIMDLISESSCATSKHDAFTMW